MGNCRVNEDAAWFEKCIETILEFELLISTAFECLYGNAVKSLHHFRAFSILYK